LPVRVGPASRDALLQASAAKVIDGRKPKLSARHYSEDREHAEHAAVSDAAESLHDGQRKTRADARASRPLCGIAGSEGTSDH
jgi:hypothetical protein